MAETPFYPEREIPAALLPAMFAGRDEARDMLARRLGQKTPARMLLVGPERIGKSSLVARVLADLDVRPLGWKIDRLLPPTFRRLVEAMFASTAERHRDDSGLADLFDRLNLHFDSNVGDVLPQFGRLLGRLKPTPIVVLDGAAPILGWPERERGIMRAFLERAGCHVVAVLDAPPGREDAPAPFDGFRVLPIGPLSRGDGRAFVERRVAAAGMKIDRDALLALEQYSANEPYFLQLLGLRTWEAALRLGKKAVDLDVLGEGVAAALETLPPELVGPFHRLDGKTRDVFVALCTLPDASPTGIGKAIQVEPKNVVVLLSRLVGHGLVRKTGRGDYEATHPLLREYVKKEWARSTL